jgi:hypothetical protein
VAAEEAEDVRHGEALWFFQHESVPDAGETPPRSGTFHAG